MTGHKTAQLIFFFIVFLTFISCKPTNSEHGQDRLTEDTEIEELRIEYLAHASFLLHYGGKTLLLDPFADSVWISYDFPKGIEADAIFSTHPHYDHDGGLFRDLHPYWEDKIPFYQDPGAHTIGAFNMEGIKGRHSEPYGKEFGQRNTIWIFEVAGLRIAHWGDNAPINDTIAPGLKNIDILMVPIDDTYHILKSDELEEVLRVVDPKIIIPMHYKIAALEKTPGVPKNLGTIEEYIKIRNNVTELDGSEFLVSKNSLPESTQYVVFQHSAKILDP